MVQGLLAHRKDEDGFTLIELLIVIIVLAILAAIVVFAVGTTRTDAVTSSCISNVKQVVVSAEAVLTKTGGYPAAQAGLIAAAPGSSTTVPGALLHSWPSSTDYTLTYTGVGGSPAVTGSAPVPATPNNDYTLVIAGTGSKLAGGTVKSTSQDSDIQGFCKAQ
jgi:general secretion pathway protein G